MTFSACPSLTDVDQQSMTGCGHQDKLTVLLQSLGIYMTLHVVCVAVQVPHSAFDKNPWALHACTLKVEVS